MKILEDDAESVSARDFILHVCTLDDEGVLRWKGNGWVPHDVMLQTAIEIGLPIDMAKCEAAKASDKQEYATSKDRIKAMTGTTGPQLRSFQTAKRSAHTKLH